MRLSFIFALLALGAFGAVACQSNVSDPPSNTTRMKFFQWESKIVYVASTDTLIDVYNDEQGVEKLVDANTIGASRRVT